MASFRKIHEDKAVGIAPASMLMAWCPSMDLMAYVTSENHIALHRLSWVKLGTFSENTSPVTALAWSPDGRTLASGHEDGSIVLYDIELQETVANFAAHSARVTALAWTPWTGSPGVGTLAPSEDRASKFMPPVIPLLDSTNSSGSRANVRFADACKSQEMTVLLSGDANGVLSLRALGASCIGSIQICVPCDDTTKIMGVGIKHISAALDLSRLAVLVQSTADDVTEQRSSDASEVLLAPDAMAHKAGTQYLAVIDLHAVAANASQLLQISSQAWVLEAAISSLHASLDSMVKSWKDAWGHMCAKLKTFEQGLQAHGSTSTPECELLTCVASGCTSPPLLQFLTCLREQGIRRWERTMDTGCSAIQQLISQRMLPVTQALLFRAGELLGMSRWDQRFRSVGLSEGGVQALLSEAERTLHKLAEVVAVTRSFQAGLVSLCHWLEKLTLRLLNDTGSTCLPSDEALLVAKFIRAHLAHDRVGTLLAGAEGSGVPIDTGHDENPNAELLSALKLLIPPTSRVSLATQLGRLRDAADFTFGETKHTISTNIHADACVRINAAAEPRAEADGDDAECRVAMIASALGGGEVEGQASDATGGSLDREEAPQFLVAMRQELDAGQSERLRLIRLAPLPLEEQRSAPAIAGGDIRPRAAGYRFQQASLRLQGSDGVEAAAEGARKVADVQFYDEQRVCVLTGPVQTGADAAAASARLLRISCADVSWGPAATVSRTRCLDASSEGMGDAAVSDEGGGVEARGLGSTDCVGIAVNGARGLASVLLRKPWRMTVLDMEDEEEDAEESMDQS